MSSPGPVTFFLSTFQTCDLCSWGWHLVCLSLMLCPGRSEAVLLLFPDTLVWWAASNQKQTDCSILYVPVRGFRLLALFPIHPSPGACGPAPSCLSSRGLCVQCLLFHQFFLLVVPWMLQSRVFSCFSRRLQSCGPPSRRRASPHTYQPDADWKGGGSSLGFGFTNSKKSFQTYSLSRQQPLSHPWSCKHKRNAITCLTKDFKRLPTSESVLKSEKCNNK